MAAAPAADPTPLVAPDLPPVKRKAATAGWSLLPPDLVRHIADCFLATNDVDCYMDFRAVCPNWRAATDDPKNKISDRRFQPRRWIILDDEVLQTQGKLLLLNTDTGRFLRKKLPLLREHYVVAATPSGFFVLANRRPPHAASIFNPLTGILTRFAAPVPPDARVAAVDYNKDDSPTILLFGDSSCTIYMAVPDSEGFTAEDYEQEVYHFVRNGLVGGAYSHISGSGFVDVVAELLKFLRSIHGDPVKFFSRDYPRDSNGVHCFLVGLAAHMLLVVKAFGTPFVFKMNTETGKIEPVDSIITMFAIFIGHCRSLSVDTNKYRGIQANCIYYTEHLGSLARIRKFNLKDGKDEIISETPEFVEQDKQFALIADRPFTIIQLLCSYTIDILDSHLPLQQMS